jgi:hypothetical protein
VLACLHSCRTMSLCAFQWRQSSRNNNLPKSTHHTTFRLLCMTRALSAAPLDDLAFVVCLVTATRFLLCCFSTGPRLEASPRLPCSLFILVPRQIILCDKHCEEAMQDPGSSAVFVAAGSNRPLWASVLEGHARTDD